MTDLTLTPAERFRTWRTPVRPPRPMLAPQDPELWMLQRLDTGELIYAENSYIWETSQKAAAVKKRLIGDISYRDLPWGSHQDPVQTQAMRTTYKLFLKGVIALVKIRESQIAPEYL